ncbi:TolC family protein [candidate division WOR-3 bacterium]|nr:TolC family protein [candidate division WOR-3 bacterium]
MLPPRIRPLLLALAVSGPVLAGTDTLRLDADAAVELALHNPNSVELARQQLIEAAAGRGAAFGSFLPQVSATGSYTRLGRVNEFAMGFPIPGKAQFPVYDPYTGELIGLTDSIPIIMGYGYETLALGGRDNYALRGSVTQTLFTWGKLVNAYRIADLSLDLQAEAVRQSRAQTRVQATETFYQALLAQRMAGLMRESYAQLRRHVARAQSLYDNGLATRLDVMRASVGLTNMEAQVSQLENAEGLALAALRNLTGTPEDRPVVLEGELAPENLSFDLGELVDSALARRPEVRQLRQTARMAGLGVNIARTANLPTAFAAFNYTYGNPVGFSAGWGSDWNVTAGVSWPIFTGGANLARLKQARARLRQAEVGVRMLEDGVRLEVRAQLAALNQEQKNSTYQAKNVELAREALNLAEQRYQNGLLTNLEFLDTQLALTQSRVLYLSSLANYQIARARLLRAVGQF